MYSKKYKFEKIEQFGGRRMWPCGISVYDGMEGRTCYPTYLKVGDRGWILYEREDEPGGWPHRLHTSIVQNVDYVVGDELKIVIVTEHTRLTLREVTDE